MGTLWTDLLDCQVRYLGSRYRTRVIEAGEGPLVILLHGNGGHAETYSRNIARLGQNFHVMAVDMVWHGFSADVPFNEAMVPTYAEQMLELIDAAGAGRASFEGESLGGWVGLWMALHHPDKVDALVLNTPAGIRFGPAVTEHSQASIDIRQRSFDALNDPTPEKIRRRLEWLMASPDRVTDELVGVRLAIYSMAYRKQALLKVNENSFGFGSGVNYQIPEEDVKGIKAPTLVLWSEHNPGTGPAAGERLAKLIPNAEYYCIMDAGHWPQWEKPEEHDRVVGDFLRRHVTH
jgi:pimeloyl-ACP methyl ester carboxylesterase